MDSMMLFLHLLGACVWVGGLVAIALVAVSSGRALDQPARTELFRVVGIRFLIVAGIAVTLLVISGNLLLEDRFGGWADLGDVPGGSDIYWKTALFLGVLALAALHSLVLAPRIRVLRSRQGADTQADLRRTLVVSRVLQVLMLAGSIAILAFAA